MNSVLTFFKYINLITLQIVFGYLMYYGSLELLGLYLFFIFNTITNWCLIIDFGASEKSMDFVVGIMLLAIMMMFISCVMFFMTIVNLHSRYSQLDLTIQFSKENKQKYDMFKKSYIVETMLIYLTAFLFFITPRKPVGVGAGAGNMQGVILNVYAPNTPASSPPPLLKSGFYPYFNTKPKSGFSSVFTWSYTIFKFIISIATLPLAGYLIYLANDFIKLANTQLFIMQSNANVAANFMGQFNNINSFFTNPPKIKLGTTNFGAGSYTSYFDFKNGFVSDLQLNNGGGGGGANNTSDLIALAGSANNAGLI